MILFITSFLCCALDLTIIVLRPRTFYGAASAMARLLRRMCGVTTAREHSIPVAVPRRTYISAPTPVRLLEIRALSLSPKYLR